MHGTLKYALHRRQPLLFLPPGFPKGLPPTHRSSFCTQLQMPATTYRAGAWHLDPGNHILSKPLTDWHLFRRWELAFHFWRRREGMPGRMYAFRVRMMGKGEGCPLSISTSTNSDSPAQQACLLHSLLFFHSCSCHVTQALDVGISMLDAQLFLGAAVVTITEGEQRAPLYDI